MEEILRFIKPELLVLIPVLYFVGIGIKKSNIPNSRIPLLLGLISIFLSTLWVFSTSEIFGWQDISKATFTSITQGILAAGASVYANQLYIQLKKMTKSVSKGGGKFDCLRKEQLLARIICS